MITMQHPDSLSLGEFRTKVTSAAREPLLARIAKLEAQISELLKDRARLDWLDKQVKHHPVYSGYSWQEAGYENDRGLVCKIQTKKERTSVREAIDNAINTLQKEDDFSYICYLNNN
jgi:hypothetical protein